MVAQTIQLILAPVVMVTACAITLNGLLPRYGQINDRLRGLTRERLDLLRAVGPEATEPAAAAGSVAAERIAVIDRQAPDLLRRHRRVHDAVLTLFAAMIVFVATMFVIALAAAADSPALATVALLLFLAGTAVVLAGVVVASLEVGASHRALQFEVERALSLGSGEQRARD
jgi:hypothetical protein